MPKDEVPQSDDSQAGSKVQTGHHFYLDNVLKANAHRGSDSSAPLSSVSPSVHQRDVFLNEPNGNDESDKKFQYQELDAVPTTMAFVETINNVSQTRSLSVLADSGSTFSYISQAALPSGVKKCRAPTRTAQTALGVMQTQDSVVLSNLTLPEFGKSLKFQSLNAHVIPHKLKYDIILGRDFLQKAGFDLSFSSATMNWQGRTVPFKSKDEPYALYIDPDDEDLDDFFVAADPEIRPREYQKTTIEDVVKQCTHLTDKQRAKLLKCLSKKEKLFSGKLGQYKHKRMHLTLKPGAQPVHCKPYPVPHRLLPVFKNELQALCNDGVLERIGGSEHAYPTFIIPKRSGTVRWVSDFRKLNAQLVRTQYPLLRIQDLLRKCKGYAYMTKIDISMQYYTFRLTEEASNLCVIITPFGKYRYLSVPMGVHTSPDFAQQVMDEIFDDLDFVDFYLDDGAIFSDSFDEHMEHVSTVLNRLQENGFTVNPLKCVWAVKETDFLGYWITPTGVKPWRKKIDAMLKIAPPTTIKQLRSFNGAINYYRDMWPRRSHHMAPLSDLTGKNKFEWLPKHQEAFDKLKQMIAVDAILAYPDHNKPFHIETDSSDFQMGGVIKQDGRPVAYWSKKLNSAQRNYTVTEKELLSIVMILHEFRTMLLGAELHIHTDHRNLTYVNLNSARVLRWRLYIEEYAPNFHYIPGEANALADFLSRSPTLEGKDVPGLDDPFTTATHPRDMYLFDELQHLDFDMATDFFYLQPDDSFVDELTDCFINIPNPRPPYNPTDYRVLQQQQQQQPNLWTLPQTQPQLYQFQRFGNSQLVTFRPYGQHNFRIVVPDAVIPHLVNWYHSILGHAGMSSLESSLNSTFVHPEISRRCADIVRTCPECQRFKSRGAGYGQLAPREALAAPWYEVQVDTIGPWVIKLGDYDIEFWALTMIDTVTNLAELVRLPSRRPSSEVTARAFEINWLLRYPRPMRVVHDQGTEFKANFLAMLRTYGIDPVPTTVRNPQANAIIERSHQVVGNILRTALLEKPVATEQEAERLMDYALANACFAMRATINRTLKMSPGSLAFHRDMTMDLPFVANFLQLRDRRQALIDYNLRRENARRRNHDYKVGDFVLEMVDNPTKLGYPTKGPFRITQIHTNGTITIQRRPHVTDRVNIRRFRPYHT